MLVSCPLFVGHLKVESVLPLFAMIRRALPGDDQTGDAPPPPGARQIRGGRSVVPAGGCAATGAWNRGPRSHPVPYPSPAGPQRVPRCPRRRSRTAAAATELRSVTAIAARLSSVAHTTSSSGCETPVRKVKFVVTRSSAYAVMRIPPGRTGPVPPARIGLRPAVHEGAGAGGLCGSPSAGNRAVPSARRDRRATIPGRSAPA